MGFTRSLFAAVGVISVVALDPKPYVVKDSQTNAEGKDFLANVVKTNPNVKVMKSGLIFEVLEKGSGSKHPTASSPCDCHYKGTLIDGKN